jgi:hypothetical protein
VGAVGRVRTVLASESMTTEGDVIGAPTAAALLLLLLS